MLILSSQFGRFFYASLRVPGGHSYRVFDILSMFTDIEFYINSSFIITHSLICYSLLTGDYHRRSREGTSVNPDKTNTKIPNVGFK